MGELVERTVAVVGRTAGNTVGPAVTAMMTAAGVALGHPELTVWAVPAGAAAGSITEEGVALVRRAWEDKAERIERFAETAAADAGAPISDLLESALAEPRLRQLLARAVQAASEAIDEEKIDVLARAFARGAMDGAKVNGLLLLINFVRNLDAAHMRALAALFQLHETAELEKRRLDRFEDAFNDAALVQVDPGLDGSLVFVMSTLRSLGLVDGNRLVPRSAGDEEFGWKFTELGITVAKALEELGKSATMPR